MFNVGWYYKYKNENKWYKCIRKDKNFYIEIEELGWFVESDSDYLEESKYHPDLKKKLRRILDV